MIVVVMQNRLCRLNLCFPFSFIYMYTVYNMTFQSGCWENNVSGVVLIYVKIKHCYRKQENKSLAQCCGSAYLCSVKRTKRLTETEAGGSITSDNKT